MIFSVVKKRLLFLLSPFTGFYQQITHETLKSAPSTGHAGCLVFKMLGGTIRPTCLSHRLVKMNICKIKNIVESSFNSLFKLFQQNHFDLHVIIIFFKIIAVIAINDPFRCDGIFLMLEYVIFWSVKVYGRH